MSNKNKIFLNDIPLDLFLEYFSSKSLERVKNEKVEEELKHYKKIKYKCTLDYKGVNLSEKIYYDPIGKGPTGNLLLDRIFADKLRITGINNKKYTNYFPNGIDEREVTNNKKSHIRMKLFKYNTEDYILEYNFSYTTGEDYIVIKERASDNSEVDIITISTADVLNETFSGNEGGLKYVIEIRRNEKEKLSDGTEVSGKLLPVNYIGVSIFPQNLNVQLNNVFYFYTDELDLEDFVSITVSNIGYDDRDDDGYFVYRTYYNEDNEIETYYQAFLVKNLTSSDRQLVTDGDFFNYPDNYFIKNITLSKNNEEIQSIVKESSRFYEEEFDDLTVYSDEIQILDGYKFRIAKMNNKMFPKDYLEYEFRAENYDTSETLFYRLVLNPKMYMTKTNSFGKNLYKDKNGFITVEDGYDSLLQAHHKSIRRAFHHLDTDHSFTSYMDPGVLFMLNHANEEQYVYFNRLTKTRRIKKILNKSDVIEPGDYYIDGEDIKMRLQDGNSISINKNSIQRSNLSSLLFNGDASITTDIEEFNDVMELSGTKDFPVLKVYTDENFITNNKSPIFNISDAYFMDNNIEIDPDKIYQLELYKRYASIVTNKLSDSVKTIPISYENTVYVAVKLSDTKDDNSLIAQNIAEVDAGNEILVETKLFENKYIAIALRRHTGLLTTDSDVNKYETLEDFDGKYIHIFFGSHPTDLTAEKIVGKISYRSGDVSFSIIDPATDVKLSTVPLMLPDEVSAESLGWDVIIPIYIDGYVEKKITEDVAIGKIVML